jgi:glutathione gamma-glutamylcysteinyltransferase
MPEFYKRPLPASCVDFASAPGRAIFAEALSAGTMEGFFTLISQFTTQNEPAYCGLATLSMALNALQVDPGRVWKGVWRWYDESLLDCCKGLQQVQQEGITLDEFVCLVRCNGCDPRPERAVVKVAGHTPGTCGTCGTVESFRAAVSAAATSSDTVLCVSYCRSVLGQTGTGHFSPIGGYHADRDLVLILDVARFKYPPHYVPLTLLFEAMCRTDKSTGKTRGWIRVAAGTGPPLLGACGPLCASADDVATADHTLCRITCGQAPNFVCATHSQPQYVWLRSVGWLGALAVGARLALMSR